MTTELSKHPLLVLRLRGSQRAMGEELGRLLRAQGGYEDSMTFYPTMAARMLSLSLPHAARRPFEVLARALLGVEARRMHAHRARRFPEYTARTEALLRASGHDVSLAPSFMVMDVLQNAVSVLARAGALPAHIGRFAAVPACSSLAVWDASSSDGALRHARNFDFPGAGVWDAAPVVTFCTPDEGLRYGFVSTRGADTPGVTCFNEAGLTLTMHTRFHRDVRTEGTPVIDIGHEIIRTSRTLRDAIVTATRIGASSTWGMLVSSAAERSAVLIETTGTDVCVLRPGEHDSHLACTNRYRVPSLRAREVTTSRVYIADSESRFRRLEQAVQEAVGGLSAEDLEALLGDYGSPHAADRGDGVVRLAGDCVVSPITVQSIVSEPESRRIRVSVGAVPAGFGPYLGVPWDWDGAPAETVAAPAAAPRAKSHRGHDLSADERETTRLYADLARKHVEGASPSETRRAISALVDRAPREPSFRALAAFCAMQAGDLEAATVHLDAALALEEGAFRRGRLLLFQTRVRAALGDARGAKEARDELLAMTALETLAEREAAYAEQERPFTRRALSRVVLDIMLVDAALPNAA